MEPLLATFGGSSQKLAYAVGGVVVAVGTVVILRKLLSKKKDFPRDTVILYQLGRGPYAPSLSPFAVKLETYLRMARIPYQNVHGFKTSSKGKVPWIEYNGKAVADSTLCINFLNEKLGVDLNKHLNPRDKGVAMAMQIMTEEHLYWFLALFRYKYDNDKTFIKNTSKIGFLVVPVLKYMVTKATWAQGLGRHTQEEVTQMFKKDLQSLSDFIGDNKFLIGDQPCETDCAVFGQLSQLYWHFLGTGHENIFRDKYPNLAAYCERMKDTFWPDWEECNTHGGTREATK